MKKILVILSMAALVASYNNVDDTINIEDLIKDVPMMKDYMDCFLDKGPCMKQVLAYKSNLKELINDGCREGNDRERHLVRVFLQGLKEDLPEVYKEFRAKYDPDNKHFDAAVKAVEKY